MHEFGLRCREARNSPANAWPASSWRPEMTTRGPFAREGQRRGTADAGERARDQNDLVAHGHCPLIVPGYRCRSGRSGPGCRRSALVRPAIYGVLVRQEKDFVSSRAIPDRHGRHGTSPPALLRRGRRGRQLHAGRGAAAAHRAAIAQPADPRSRDGAWVRSPDHPRPARRWN